MILSFSMKGIDFEFQILHVSIEYPLIEFEFEDECVSLDGILSIIQSIEEAGKHEVTEVKFCTEYDEFYGEDPYSAIYLHKK